MIRTLRGLAISAGLAVVLAIVAIALRVHTGRAVNRALMPGFDPASVVGFGLRYAQGAGIGLERDGDTWRTVGSAHGRADSTTVDALVTALRGARWHRSVPAPEALSGPGHDVLEVRMPDGFVEIVRGEPLPGAGQTWVIIGGEQLLVDDWVVRALFPSPLDLTIRHLFRNVEAADTLRSGDVEVKNTALLVKPHDVWLDTPYVDELVSAMADLEIDGLEGTPGPDGRHVHMVAAGVDKNVADVGTCAQDHVLVNSSASRGCVPRAAWQRVLDAFDALTTTPVEQLADPRVAPVTPHKLDFGDGTVIDLAKPGNVDADRLDAIVAALGATGEIRATRPTGAPRRTLVVDGGRNIVTLAIYDDGIVREGESFTLVPPPAVISVLLASPVLLRDPVLWREDATTVSSLVVDGVTYTRGAVLGEWTGATDPAVVDALASTVAMLRAPAGPPPAHVAHTIRVTFTPPVGTPSSHVLELGAPSAAGCPARVDGAAVALDLALCTAAMAVAEQHHHP